ncbi:MAG: VWA domain-containing protein [Verrucomicrobia bacterium]|nr:VWA domain-containing protein [Verrucomicrobiota bacterium]
MNFASPHFLWLLLLVPALVAFFWWAGRVKERLMTQFIQARLLAGLLVDVSKARQQTRLALMIAAVAVLAVTLARPRWGYGWEEVKQRGLDVVVAIDTSRSMLANDVAPNRLDRAKLEAIALKQLCKADRLGLVAFAGTAFLQCPLSLDDEAFRQSLEALDASIIPQGGTALAEAIRTALTAFKDKNDNHKVLVIFTDGEDHEGDAVEATRDAAKEGMRLFTIGVGTPAGELISIPGEGGKTTFLKDENGQAIKSRLNEPLLQEMASVGNGFYLPLSGARTMDTLYERGLKPLPRTDSESKMVQRFHERFQWFIGVALLLLLAEMFWPEAGPGSRFKVQGSKLAVALIALGCLLPFGTEAASAGKAMRDYQKGRYDRAFREYERLATKKPDDARLHFNMGAAAYQDKDYDAAVKQFSSSLATPSGTDVKLQEQAYYNLGNARFRLGEEQSDLEKRKAEWQQAVSSFDSALKLEPKDEDARFNLELVKKKLEELKQQQQQQQQNQDKKDDKDQQDKSQQNKDDQKNQQQQQQQDKKDDQQSQQQKQEQEKQQQEQQQQQQQEKQDKKPDEEQQAATTGKPMQMTPQQAKQLLDAVKAEEKTLIFVPPPTNRTDRRFKNW